jgi:hypothetical protein
MTTTMDEPFAAALRDVLVEQVQTAGNPSDTPGRSRRWIVRAGVVLVLAAGGGGIAYATGAWTTPPGGDRITGLASPVTATGTGTQTVDLGPPPRGATAINISFTCLTAGNFTFADGAGVQCGRPDVRRRSPPVANYTMPIARDRNSTTITATPHARWRLVATYASVTTTAWGVNASGQTYGVQNQHGTPDLIAVIATNHRSGYVYANQLDPPPPKTPSQAIVQNNAPPRTLTVYESDGKTSIGKFIVGG